MKPPNLFPQFIKKPALGVIYLISTIILFLILIIEIIYFSYQKDEIVKDKNIFLLSVTQVKVQRISEWFNRWNTLLMLISKDNELKSEIIKTIKNQSNIDKAILSSKILSYQNNLNKLGYIELFVFIPDKNILIPYNYFELDSLDLSYINEVIRTSQPITSDVFLDQRINKFLIKFYFPILQNEKLIGILIARKEFLQDIQQILSYPKIELKSYESFLVKKEKDTLIVLSNLNRIQSAPLNVHIPLTVNETNLLDSIYNVSIPTKLISYAGENVLSFSMKIPGLNWHVISNINEDEIYKSINNISYLFYSLTFIVFISWFAIVTLVNKSARKKYREEFEKVDKKFLEIENKFQITMDSLSDGIIITDENGIIEYMNNAAERLTGWNFNETRGRDLREIYRIKNEVTGEWELNPFEKVKKLGIVKYLANHTILVNKQGSEIPVKDAGVAIKNRNGEVKGVVIVFEDETERRLYEKAIINESTKFKTLVDSLPVECMILGFDWAVMYCNYNFSNKLGKERKFIIGKQIFDLFPDFIHTETFRHFFNSMQNRNIENFESELLLPDNKKHYYLITSQPVEEGILCVLNDITIVKEAETKIIESEKRYKSIAENLEEILFMIEPQNYKILYVNKACEKILGYTQEEIISQNPIWWTIALPEDQERIKNIFYEGLLRKEKIITEFQTKTKNGDLIWLKVRISPVYDDEGRITQLIGLAYDLTREKEIELKLIERERFLSELFESINDLILVSSLPERKIIMANKAIETMVGYTVDEVIGKSTLFLIGDENTFKELGNKIQNAVQNNSRFLRTEIQARKKDGNSFWVELDLNFIRDENNSVKYVITIVRDITERKKMIDELIKAKEDAEEAYRIMSNFLSAMSHEFRTPLNAIMGYSDLIYEELIDKINAEQKFYFEALKRGTKRMLETATQILNISKLEAGEVKLEKVPLHINEYVSRISEDLKVLALEKNISIKVNLDENDPVIINDPYGLETILINIIGNAIKFSEKGEINISTQIEDKRVKVVVQDQGVGIDPEFQKHLFKKFGQEEVGTRRSFEGTGLGLTITKSYIDLMGGEIKIESEKGKGTTVTIYFPLSE
jgi:PAS domain S-box-containing protein